MVHQKAPGSSNNIHQVLNLGCFFLPQLFILSRIKNPLILIILFITGYPTKNKVPSQPYYFSHYWLSYQR